MNPTRREVIQTVGLALTGLPVAAQTQAAGPHTLWYRKPATNWEREALPVGNGNLGAMVFGGVPKERIQLNEHSLWSGHREDVDNPQTLEYLPKVRQLLFEGKYAEANQMAARSMIVRARTAPASYQTLGDLTLEFRHTEAALDYRRELDLDTGIARVTYRADGARFTREVFASHPDQAIVVRLESEKPGGLAFAARLSRPAEAKIEYSAPGRIVMRGQAAGDGAAFECHVEARNEGGKLTATPEGLNVEGANAVTLFLVAATNYKLDYDNFKGGKDPGAACKQRLETVVAKRYAAVRAAHVTEHRRLFRRVSLDLGGPDRSATPTDERLAAMQAGGDDPQLLATYFQYGRYLLMSSSRPGTMPANLQGLWADGLTPPWSADYHVNINIQMNYWPAEVTNLSGVSCTAVRLHGHAAGARAEDREDRLRVPRVRGALHDQRVGTDGAVGRHTIRSVARGIRLAGTALLGALRLHRRP